MVYTEVQNFDQPSNRSTSHSWDMFHPLFLVKSTPKMLFLSAKCNNWWTQDTIFKKQTVLQVLYQIWVFVSQTVQCYIKQNTHQFPHLWNPAAWSTCTANWQIYTKKNTKNLNELSLLKEAGKKIKAARKLMTFCKYCSTNLKFFSALIREKVLSFIDSQLKYQ